jgi:hypothetical protein
MRSSGSKYFGIMKGTSGEGMTDGPRASLKLCMRGHLYADSPSASYVNSAAKGARREETCFRIM